MCTNNHTLVHTHTHKNTQPYICFVVCSSLVPVSRSQKGTDVIYKQLIGANVIKGPFTNFRVGWVDSDHNLIKPEKGLRSESLCGVPLGAFAALLQLPSASWLLSFNRALFGHAFPTTMSKVSETMSKINPSSPKLFS